MPENFKFVAIIPTLKIVVKESSGEGVWLTVIVENPDGRVDKFDLDFLENHEGILIRLHPVELNAMILRIDPKSKKFRRKAGDN